MTDPEARAERARRRAQLPGHVGRLGDPERPSVLSPAEGFLAVERISVDAWLLAGRALPTCPRAELPGRVIRPGPGEDG